MARSMTGYATTTISLTHAVAHWELKSLNHRFFDLTIRLPDAWRTLEPEIRARLAAQLTRGKIEVRLTLDEAELLPALTLNSALLHALRQLQEQLLHHFPNAQPLTIGELLTWPGLLISPPSAHPRDREQLLAAFDAATAELIAHRTREGEQLVAAIRQRIEQLAELLATARRLAPEAQQRHHAQLLAALALLTPSNPPERLQQEIALLLQRIDITEELDRLDAHLRELTEILANPHPIGKRLDFLLQELNRETNTLAAKSAHPSLTRLALDMKLLIEQMREQAQNLE
ncbi:MAG: YicC family protein [Hydrogenophilus sp.]|nr:YicC family protein [Hydrogenophilus sp.]